MNCYVPGMTAPDPDNTRGVALWVYPYEGAVFGKCSLCGETLLSKPGNYCPNCGAVMANAYESKAHYDWITKTAEGENQND